MLVWSPFIVRLAACVLATKGCRASRLIDSSKFFKLIEPSAVKTKLYCLLCQNSVLDVTKLAVDVEKLSQFNRGLALLCGLLEGPKLQRWNFKGKFISKFENQEEADLKERKDFVCRNFTPYKEYQDLCKRYV